MKRAEITDHLEDRQLDPQAKLVIPVTPGKHPASDTATYARRITRYKVRRGDTVQSVADNFGEAFAKAQLAAGQKLPTQGCVFISVTDHDKPQVAEVARKFVDMGFNS